MELSVLNNLFLFSLRICELTAIASFLSACKKRKEHRLINIGLTLTFAFLLMLSREMVYLIPDIENEFFYITFAYYSLLYAYIMVKFQISPNNGVYYLLLIFLCVHALRQTVMRLSFALHGVNFTVPEASVTLRIVYTALYFLLLQASFRLVNKSMHTNQKKSWRQLLWLYIAIIPVIYITNLGLIMGFEQTNLPLTTAIIAQVCSFCGLVVVMGYNNTLALGQKEIELARLEAMLQSQHEQYRLRKETVDILNRRYHDFKNHLLCLDVAEHGKEREEYIRQIEQEINAYDQLHHTGNEALDVVLISKGMECSQMGIRMILLLDGKLLSFLKPLAIATIFGNAIDNGIQALQYVEENKKELTIRVSEGDNWVILRFENYYSGRLRWHEGKLLSTKPDPDGHGAGISIIDLAVQEYGGNVSIDAAEDWFALNILFPKTKRDEDVSGSLTSFLDIKIP